jgi:hypothetical protein
MRSGFPDLVYEVKQKDDLLEIPANGMSLDLLQAIYRNSSLPLSVRIRAAGLAIPYETPKLIATAVMNEGSFADLLERRLKRIEQMKLIEAKPTSTDSATNGGAEVTARLAPIIPDRRFRRI